MENKDYLTIAEFAEAVGVSKQAIYKQVNNSNSQIAPYLLQEGKKIFIKASALKELYKVDSTHFETPNSTFTTSTNPFSNPENQPYTLNSTQENQNVSVDYIEFLKAQIAELKVEKADIEQRLNNAIKERDGIIKEQSAQLSQLAQQVAQIADKALVATSQQQYLTAMEKTEKPHTETNIIKPTEEQISNKPKKNIFQRWFGL